MPRREFLDNGNWVACSLIRQGRLNSRVELDSGESILVPTESLRNVSIGNQSRLIPTVPLELFYRQARSFTGSKSDKYLRLRRMIMDGHGPRGHEFLAELFQRSIQHGAAYCNVDEPFYAEREDTDPEDPLPDKFAARLVTTIDQDQRLVLASDTYHFIDYEIYPYRTTLSCTELGTPATRSGSGGMDLFLTQVIGSQTIPTVGEVKALTETVGPTFALIQALMYAAQIATPHQFERLKSNYTNHFNSLDCATPKVNLLIFLEIPATPDGIAQVVASPDFQFARGIAQPLQASVQNVIHSIQFVLCSMKADSIQMHYHE